MLERRGLFEKKPFGVKIDYEMRPIQKQVFLRSQTCALVTSAKIQDPTRSSCADAAMMSLKILPAAQPHDFSERVSATVACFATSCFVYQRFYSSLDLMLLISAFIFPSMIALSLLTVSLLTKSTSFFSKYHDCYERSTGRSPSHD